MIEPINLLMTVLPDTIDLYALYIVLCLLIAFISKLIMSGEDDIPVSIKITFISLLVVWSWFTLLIAVLLLMALFT